MISRLCVQCLIFWVVEAVKNMPIKCTRRASWNNHHQVRSYSKDWKTKSFKSLCEQVKQKAFTCEISHLACWSSTKQTSSINYQKLLVLSILYLLPNVNNNYNSLIHSYFIETLNYFKRLLITDFLLRPYKVCLKQLLFKVILHQFWVKKNFP